MSKGPSFGLFLNLKKCEILWPSGDQAFPEIASEVRRIHTSVHGVELLGSPIVGSEDVFIKYFSDRVDKVLEAQGILTDLENSQVKLHLLWSCLSVCKINHLRRTVPGHFITKQLCRFASGMRHAFTMSNNQLVHFESSLDASNSVFTPRRIRST